MTLIFHQRKPHANQFKDWLYGVAKKPGRRSAPAEKILDLWADGMPAAEIRKQVKRDSGQEYQAETIFSVVRRAREEGDPRAKARR